MRGMYLENGSELVKMYRKVKGTGVTTSLDMALPTGLPSPER
jgi:hypothetical protein